MEIERILNNEELDALQKKSAIDLLPNADRVRLFVSGTAGTGKSFLINVLTDELSLKYTIRETRAMKPAVLIAAPTGLAAVQIKGDLMLLTSHSNKLCERARKVWLI